MGLIEFLRRLFFPRAAPPRPSVAPPPRRGAPSNDSVDTPVPTSHVHESADHIRPDQANGAARTVDGAPAAESGRTAVVSPLTAHDANRNGQPPSVSPPSTRSTPAVPGTVAAPRPPVVLVPLRFEPRRSAQTADAIEVSEIPYRFARFGVRSGGFLDLSCDGDDKALVSRQLPLLKTPEDLARWLDLPLGKLAWLVHRFSARGRPATEREAHYHFRWARKRSGGWRLIESPKSTLKAAQSNILEGILNHVSAHPAAHGFVPGRSIVTNAGPHVGREVIVRHDLSNFYATVTLARVAAIFRSLGYPRDVAAWLARLCTSAAPQTIEFPGGEATGIRPYLRAHLPQGAPTSPALANLSAFSLDVRLDGLARRYGGVYTRYADDLTFSGQAGFVRGLPTFLPLVEQIVRDERFRTNRAKRRIVRRRSCQSVTGVVVNERPNIRRKEFDRLKAILTNCVRHGPDSQNRERKENFAAWLRGRIAHVQSIHAERGAKLLAIYKTIRWS